MVKRDVVAQKIARASAWLTDAERRVLTDKEQFLSHAETRDLAMFHLFLAIQECIDLAMHWVSDDGLPPADDYGSAFDVLRENGRIAPPLAAAMRSAVGLRNLIAHGYAQIDSVRVYTEAKAGIPFIRQFLDEVAKAVGL